MIKVTTKNGLDIFISLCDDDVQINGEYYCNVYLKEDDCIDIDNFVIYKKDLDRFKNHEDGINVICEEYAKKFDDMPYLNQEFNEIYQKVSDAYALINKFYLKHIFFNKRYNPVYREEMATLLDKMGNVKELAHDIAEQFNNDIAEHFTWE